MKDAYPEGLKIPVSAVRFRLWALENKGKTSAAGFVPSPPCALNPATRVPAGCQRPGRSS